MSVGRKRLSTAMSGNENSCLKRVSNTHNSPFLTHALASIFSSVPCPVPVSCGREPILLLNLPYHATVSFELVHPQPVYYEWCQCIIALP